MAINQEIFKIKQLCNYIFSIQECKLNNKLEKLSKVSTQKYMVYKYKNLNLIVNDKNEKECTKLENVGYKIMDNILINYYKETPIAVTSFPFINNYDSIIEKTVMIYNYNNKSLMFVKEKDVKGKDVKEKDVKESTSYISYIKVNNFTGIEIDDLISNTVIC